jgi:GxxExxY protein
MQTKKKRFSSAASALSASDIPQSLNKKGQGKVKGNPMVFENELLHKDITDKILNAFYKILNPQLGYGFLEKVYLNAMCIALKDMGMSVQQQPRVVVYFQGHIVGEYWADLLVEDSVIVELKASSHISDEHTAQLLNYLRATPYEVGLLLNFGPKPDFRRKVFSNIHKTVTWSKDAENVIEQK